MTSSHKGEWKQEDSFILPFGSRIYLVFTFPRRARTVFAVSHDDDGFDGGFHLGFWRAQSYAPGS